MQGCGAQVTRVLYVDPGMHLSLAPLFFSPTSCIDKLWEREQTSFPIRPHTHLHPAVLTHDAIFLSTSLSSFAP